ncbi:hypothetical protein RFI_13986 [Reticulomyxa filosa]|uniref:Uncharacterized protein n=1 Tax=Reticulomyxa filosa TaxID=46433 RepID=X6NA71_RETFI|nr:hypothetical protein RFI_13986 [Reticulomyxa filosa]|eukprot:ETO23195.1 hypothetical protein RFI_13986 [Reticulomyxa filosa]
MILSIGNNSFTKTSRQKITKTTFQQSAKDKSLLFLNQNKFNLILSMPERHQKLKGKQKKKKKKKPNLFVQFIANKNKAKQNKTNKANKKNEIKQTKQRDQINPNQVKVAVKSYVRM